MIELPIALKLPCHVAFNLIITFFTADFLLICEIFTPIHNKGLHYVVLATIPADAAEEAATAAAFASIPALAILTKL